MFINDNLKLPHFSSRHGRRIDSIILHYPAPNMEYEKPYSALAVFENLKQHGYSYHYYVTKEGEIYQFVEDEEKAWHAGVSNLHGENNCNIFSIGVCMENNGGELYSKEILQTASTLCTELVNFHRIPLNRTVGHCHVSPGRKKDPGVKFSWFGFMKEMKVK